MKVSFNSDLITPSEESRILINAALISLSFHTATNRDEADTDLIERMRAWVRDSDSIDAKL